MPLVSAYQCEYSGKLFPLDDKEKYLKHRRKQRISALDKLRREKNIKIRKDKLLEERLKCKSLEDVLLYVKNNAALIQCLSDRKYEQNIVIEGVSFSNVREGQCSNTHGCPIDGVRNFYSNKDFPTSYVGAHLNISLNISKGDFNSSLWRDVGVYFGSGGGSMKNLLYYFTVWYDDFPYLKEDYECRKTMEIMKNDN